MPTTIIVLITAAIGLAQSLTAVTTGHAARQIGSGWATLLFLAVSAAWAAVLVPLSGGWPGVEVWTAIPPYLLLPVFFNAVTVIWLIGLVNWIGAGFLKASTFWGQAVIGLTLDHIGFLDLPVIEASPARVAGLVTTLAGIWLLTRIGGGPQPLPAQNNVRPEGKVRPLMAGVLLGMGVGGIMGLFGSITAQLGQVVGALPAAALFLGLSALVWAGIFFSGIGRRQDRWPGRHRLALPVKGWRWSYLVPGTLNVIAVTGPILMIPLIGLQMVVSIAVTAAVLTSLLVDRFGWLGMPRYALTPGRVLAVGVLIMGVVLTALGTLG